ncbi:MAG UNVERIFIED_CONTAM: hypothetical protein LVR18_45815 [Planctomycetaceae bacterium]
MITGGENPAGIGVLVSGASEISAIQPAATIEIDSTGDADIQARFWLVDSSSVVTTQRANILAA